MSIPYGLKPGAIVSCRSRPSSAARDQKVFVVVGYRRQPEFGGSYGVLIEGLPNHNWGTSAGDQGWNLDRWDVIRDGDGFDYQADDDVDLRQGSAP
jgi:hypothetical protein